MDFLEYRGNQAEVETRLVERVFIQNNTIKSGFSPLQRAMGENATIPSMGMGPLDMGIAEPPTSDAEFLRSIDRSRRGIDKSKVITKTLRQAHSTLGDKNSYRICHTLHFKGTGNRKGCWYNYRY